MVLPLNDWRRALSHVGRQFDFRDTESAGATRTTVGPVLRGTHRQIFGISVASAIISASGMGTRGRSQAKRRQTDA
jgi:hypothetical protein